MRVVVLLLVCNRRENDDDDGASGVPDAVLSEEARETLVEKVNCKFAESGSEATPIGSIETEQCF